MTHQHRRSIHARTRMRKLFLEPLETRLLLTFGDLVQVFHNPEPDYPVFGTSVSVTDEYSLVGLAGMTPSDAGAVHEGAAYLFDNESGLLVHSYVKPATEVPNYYGKVVSLSDKYSLVGASAVAAPGDGFAGAAYLFDNASGSLLHTFTDPVPLENDAFGSYLAVSDLYALVGTGDTAHLFDTTNGHLLHTFSVEGGAKELAVSNTHALISSADGSAAFLYAIDETMSVSLAQTVDVIDRDPAGVSLSNSYALVSSMSQDSDYELGFLYDLATGELVGTLDPGIDVDCGIDVTFCHATAVAVSETVVLAGGHATWTQEDQTYGRVAAFDSTNGTLLDPALGGYFSEDDSTLAPFSTLSVSNSYALVGGGGQTVYLFDIYDDTTGPSIQNSWPDGQFDLGTDVLDSVRVVFGEPIEFAMFGQGSLTPEDVQIVTPHGQVPVDFITSLGGNAYEFHFVPQTRRGSYTVSVGPDIRDRAGLFMDQDGDGQPGELVEDAYTFSFDAIDADVVVTAPLHIASGDSIYQGLDILIDGTTVTIDGQHAFNSVQLIRGATVTHSAGFEGGMQLVIAEDLIVAASSSIDVDGRGYPSQQGPGAGGTGFGWPGDWFCPDPELHPELCFPDPGHPGYGSGGGYGGRGGDGYSLGYDVPGGGTYGTEEAPTQLGSGGGDGFFHDPWMGWMEEARGGSGGGAVKLTVLGSLLVDGRISADGSDGESFNAAGGGGSGGSVLLEVGLLQGQGVISADGGSGGWNAGGGGGGRIAIYAGDDHFTGQATANHGDGNQWTSTVAEDGTIVHVVNDTDPTFLASVQLELQDAAGNSFPSGARVKSGDDFRLQINVQDLRSGGTGIFSAYMDVAYRNNIDNSQELFTLGGIDPSQFPDLVSFNEFWTKGASFPKGNPTAWPWRYGEDPNWNYPDGDETPNEFDELGAFQSAWPESLGNSIVPLLYGRLTAALPFDEPAIITFQANPRELPTGDFVFTNDPDHPLTPNEILFGSATVTVYKPLYARDDLVTTAEDIPVAIPYLVNDDLDTFSTGTLALASFTQPLNGTVELVDGQLIYTPIHDYSNDSGTPDTFTYTMSDGQGNTDIATVTINVTAVNDAPVITNPGAMTADEDTPLVITGISVADADAGAGAVIVTASVGHGSLTLAQTAGLTFMQGDGANDTVMTFTGTLADVNAALANIDYLSDANYHGVDGLNIEVNDQGNTGTGPAKTDGHSVTIMVISVPEAPVAVVMSYDSGADDYDFITQDETPLLAWAPGDETDDISNYQYRVDGGLWVDTTEPYVEIAPSAGRHTIDIRAIDTAGQISPPASIAFTIDTSAPMPVDVHLTADTGTSDTDWITSDFTPRFLWSMPQGIDDVWYYQYSVDGEPWTDTTDPYIDMVLSEGDHLFDLRNRPGWQHR